VRAGGLQSVARRLLVPAAARMMIEHPDVRVEIFELELEEALPGLRLGAVDLVISDEYDGHPRPRPAGLTFALLHDEPVHLVLAPDHPLAARNSPLPLTSLRDEVWVASAEGTGHHAMVVGTCRSLGGYEPDVRHRANDAEIQLDLVRAMGAVALLPALTLPKRPAGLAIRDVAGANLHRHLMVVTRDGPTPPALSALVKDVTDHVPQDN
jgi:DNA-binding transcriptional LysR family regulator